MLDGGLGDGGWWMMKLARLDMWARRYDLAGRTGEARKQKIRSRLRSYERKLQKEKREHGFYRTARASATRSDAPEMEK